MEREGYLLQLLTDSVCLKQDQLLGYLNHTLIKEEQRVVEVHLACCPLCREAIEGAKKNTVYKDLISELRLPDLPVRKSEIKKHLEEELVSNSSGLNAVKKTTLPTLPKGSFNSYKAYNTSHPKNLAWLGTLGIVALLSLGGFLFWQYKNTLHWSSLFYNPIRSASEALFSDSLFKQQNEDTVDSLKNGRVAITEEKVPPSKVVYPVLSDTIKVRDSVLLQQTKEDNIVTNSAKSNHLVKEKEISPIKTEVKKRPKADEIKDNSVKALSQNTALSNTNKPQTFQKQVKQPTEQVNGKNSDTKSVIGQNTPTQTFLNNSDYNTGFQLYQQKQYASALLYLRTAAEDSQNPNHWQAVYYSGVCNLEIGKKSRAKRLLKKVKEANIPSLSKDAREKLQSL